MIMSLSSVRSKDATLCAGHPTFLNFLWRQYRMEKKRNHSKDNACFCKSCHDLLSSNDFISLCISTLSKYSILGDFLET